MFAVLSVNKQPFTVLNIHEQPVWHAPVHLDLIKIVSSHVRMH